MKKRSKVRKTKTAETRNSSGLTRQMRTEIAKTVRDSISSLSNSAWLGPQQPVPPQAPADAADIRLWDYPIGYNLDWRPRKYTPYSFAQLRWLADNFDLLREVIERRKDEIATVPWDIVARDDTNIEDDSGRDAIKEFFGSPDGIHSFSVWQRMVLEEMFVTDASTIYPWPKQNGEVYRLDIVAGDTITPLIDESGRLPDPPNPAYVQVIKGVPYAFFSLDELIYSPRNPRPSSPIYGYSQVEQVVMTIVLGINAEMRHNYYYTAGTIPDSLVSVPDSWTQKQIAQFQAWFDAMMRGNLQRRSGGMIFVPGGIKDVALKNYEFTEKMWEWLARVICAAFHVSPQPYVQMMNRSTGETAQAMQMAEGLEPDKEWFAALMDLIIAKYFKRPDLRWQWIEDKEINIAEQSKADDLAIRNGSSTIDEIRIARGEEPYPGGVGDKPFLVTTSGITMVENVDKPPAPAEPPASDTHASAEPEQPDAQNGKVAKGSKKKIVVFRGPRTGLRPSPHAMRSRVL